MRKIISALSAILYIFLVSAAVSDSGSDPPSASQVKAAMIYSMAKYVDWPADAFRDENAPFIICVMGRGPLAAAIEALKGNTVKNRKVLIRQVSKADEADGCQILIIGESARRHVSTALNRFSRRSVLTISDIPDFAESGGVVGFVEDEGKIRFEINLSAAQDSRIVISSQLLKLAKIVRRN